MMVIPSGRRNSAPGPAAINRGTAPRIAAIVVIRIGRKRARHASCTASAAVSPRVRSASSAKSTIMIPFFLTMPISRMMPMKAAIDSSALNICKATSAPRPAEGNVEIIVSG